MYVAINGKGNARSVYIMYSYRKNDGKTSSKIYKKLGKLNDLLLKFDNNLDKVMEYAKNEALKETEKNSNDNIVLSLSQNTRISKNDNPSFNIGYLFIQGILSSLRFDNICRYIKGKHCFEYDFNAILSDLIYARILEPSSKRSSYEYANTLLEKPKYELHDVYRALDVIYEENDYIQSEIYKNSNYIHKRNNKILYYDCTNYYFEIEKDDELRKYGVSKEHRPNPIVTMGLFMDSDGFPLAFDIYPGNKNEQKTLKPLEEKVLRDFNHSKFIYCSDAGLGSEDNKLFNSTANRSFVITQSLKKLKEEDKLVALNRSNWHKIGTKETFNLDDLSINDNYEDIYYKEIPLDTKKLRQTLIVTYSLKYKAYQENIRTKQIERATKLLKEKPKLKKSYSNPNDIRRFICETAITENGEVANEKYYELNKEAINDEARYDGFYGVVTDLEGEVKDIIKINKRRWEIEECFKIMKSEFDARPVYVRKEERIKAHFLTCFLSLLVYRILENKLNNKYTTKEIISTLRKMKMTRLKDGVGYIPSYERNDITDDLHDLFNFYTDKEIITKSSMRRIIKLSKETKKI